MIYFLAFISICSFTFFSWRSHINSYFAIESRADFSIELGKLKGKPWHLWRRFIWKSLEKKHSRKWPSPKKSAFKAAIYSGVAKFLGWFGLVALYFSFLQYWLNTTEDPNLANDVIFTLEQSAHNIKAFVQPYNLPWLSQVLVMLLLGALISGWPVLERFKLHKGYKGLKKVVSLALYVLTILTSFSFYGKSFSSEQNTRADGIEQHALQIANDMQLLREAIEGDVLDQIAEAYFEEPAIAELLEVQESNQSELKHQDLGAVWKVAEYEDDNASLDIFDMLSPLRRLSFVNEEIAFEDFSTKIREQVSQLRDQSTASTAADKTTEQRATAEAEQKQKYENYSRTQADDLRAKYDGTYKRRTTAKRWRKNWVKDFVGLFVSEAYDQTIKSVVNEALRIVGQEMPFFEKLADVLLHDWVDDCINEEVERWADDFMHEDEYAFDKLAAETKSEFKTKLEADLVHNQSLQKLEEDLLSEHRELKGTLMQAEQEAKHKLSAAEKEFNRIKRAGDPYFERVRRSFKSELNSSYSLYEIGWGEDQLEDFKAFDQKWDNYKKTFAYDRHFSSEGSDLKKINTIEEVFLSFLDDNPSAKATWGYILQQEDWSGATSYYVKIEDYRFKGKPYYLLNYYLEESGSGIKIDDFYDFATDAEVARLCPPH